MEHPLVFFVPITGSPTKQTISKFLTELNKKGIYQVLAYPRSGCEIEYLSEKWFETIGYFITEAEQLGMSLWLYDDFNWPSGDAGGMVTAIPEYRLRAITVKGKGTGKISFHSHHNASLFGEKFFPDLLNPNAVDFFIETTHEQYYKHFSKYFGSVIKGIYTDEPAIGYCVTENSLPYYNGMEDDYNKLTSRCFDEDMRSSYPGFYVSCAKITGERFRSSFIKKQAAWCENHGIVLTGHLLGDFGPSESTKQNGAFLSSLCNFTLPGIDDILTDFESDILFGPFGAAEYAGKKNGAMAELFALGPCDLSYAKRRCMIYLCSAFKIGTYFAMSHLDLRGNAYIRDYFVTFSPDQPDFEGMSLFCKEAEKASELSSVDYTADVYIRYPSDVCARSLYTADQSKFNNLLTTLSYAQIQWKLIDEGEKADGRIIEFDSDLSFILDGTVTSDPQVVCSLISKKPIITDESGNAPSGIFVREFDNGLVLALNLTGKAGTYYHNGKKFFLDIHGVYLSSNLEKSESDTVTVERSFNIEYKNDNVIRLMYLCSERNAFIDCEQDTEVIFALRNGESIKLDQNLISAKNQCTRICNGMKELYKESGTVLLKKGRHLVSSENDIKFLPSVFVIGDFDASPVSGEVCSVVLKKRSDTLLSGKYVNDFGEVAFTAKVRVPENAAALKIDGTKLFTKVLINGTLIGQRIYSPYTFNIPSRFKGKTVSLEIVQYTSIAPIFGDVYYFDQHHDKVQWKDTIPPDITRLGFSECSFIIE